MSVIIEYILQFLPTLIAMAAEIGIVKLAIKFFNDAKETKEFKAVVEQNKALVNELREAKKLNLELLTKIDKIQRGTNEDGE